MEAGQKRIKLQLSGKLVYLVIQSILPYFAFCEKIKNPDSGNQDFTVFFSSRWCHQESNVLIQSPNLQHFNIFGKIPEPLNQPYAKFTNFR